MLAVSGEIQVCCLPCVLMDAWCRSRSAAFDICFSKPFGLRQLSPSSHPLFPVPLWPTPPIPPPPPPSPPLPPPCPWAPSAISCRAFLVGITAVTNMNMLLLVVSFSCCCLHWRNKRSICEKRCSSPELLGDQQTLRHKTYVNSAFGSGPWLP